MTGRMASRARFVVLPAALIALTLAIAVAPAQARMAPGQAELRTAAAALVRSGVPGVSVRYQDGRRSFAIDLGTAHRGTKRPIRPGLHFRIAGATKSFTAVVVLQLVGEGRLSLDDSVEEWLPGLAPDGARITVRELLAMRSGLGDYLAHDPQRVLAPLRNPSFWWPTLSLAQVGILQPRDFPPGTGYAYSNTNYLLLQLIVEKITGMPFGQELRRRVLRPLRLDDTTFPVVKRTLPRPAAHGYVLEAGRALRDVTRLSPSIAGASGAIVSTTRDLGRFYRALNAGRLLRSRELGEMRTPFSRLGPAASYGLGLFRLGVEGCGPPGWGHSGEIAGFQSFALSSSDGRRSVVMLLNGSGGPAKLFELRGQPFAAKQRAIEVLTCAVGSGLKKDAQT